MDLDRTVEDEKTKKKKNKGKGKQTAEDEEAEEMELVSGAARCRACMRDGEQCCINTRCRRKLSLPGFTGSRVGKILRDIPVVRGIST